MGQKGGGGLQAQAGRGCPITGCQSVPPGVAALRVGPSWCPQHCHRSHLAVARSLALCHFLNSPAFPYCKTAVALRTPF